MQKVTIPLSNFTRELLEKAYREKEENLAKFKSKRKGA